MNSIIYILSILILAGSAAFSFLNSKKHQEYTQETYEERVKNDKLEKDIAFCRGTKYKLSNIEGSIGTAKTVNDAFAYQYGAMLKGNTDPSDLSRDADRSDEAFVLKDINFLQYNRYQDETQGNDKKAVDEIEAPAEDIVVGKAKVEAVKRLNDGVSAKIGSLGTIIAELQGNIRNEINRKEGLEDEIEESVKLEKQILEEFQDEGITADGGAGQVFVQATEVRAKLETTQRERIDESNKLESTFNDRVKTCETNDETILNQKAYLEKRKNSIGANAKTYSIAAVDFDWGFLVIRPDEHTKFFIDQRLMIVRGNTYVGEVIVTGLEGEEGNKRVIANVDYKTVAKGNTIRLGDVAILAEPVDN